MQRQTPLLLPHAAGAATACPPAAASATACVSWASMCLICLPDGQHLGAAAPIAVPHLVQPQRPLRLDACYRGCPPYSVQRHDAAPAATSTCVPRAATAVPKPSIGMWPCQRQDRLLSWACDVPYRSPAIFVPTASNLGAAIICQGRISSPIGYRSCSSPAEHTAIRPSMTVIAGVEPSSLKSTEGEG